jgi:hypothetical protein
MLGFKKNACIGACIFLLHSIGLSQGDSIKMEKAKIAGYHLGVVQIAFAYNDGKYLYIDNVDFYSIGFPMGISFNTQGALIFDLEFVPVLKPYINQNNPYEIHLLLHPGVLLPLGNKWTFGLRFAFEIGQNQFGFTPLLNKAFQISKHSVFFIELVAPVRFGPSKNSGYTQLGGLHVGFGF